MNRIVTPAVTTPSATLAVKEPFVNADGRVLKMDREVFWTRVMRLTGVAENLTIGDEGVYQHDRDEGHRQDAQCRRPAVSCGWSRATRCGIGGRFSRSSSTLLCGSVSTSRSFAKGPTMPRSRSSRAIRGKQKLRERGRPQARGAPGAALPLTAVFSATGRPALSSTSESMSSMDASSISTTMRSIFDTA